MTEPVFICAREIGKVLEAGSLRRFVHSAALGKDQVARIIQANGIQMFRNRLAGNAFKHMAQVVFA